jgi:hypothetical protein
MVMEAKVLRAALSAAIRVTVSTSLLGCGGVTSGGQSEAPAGSDPPATDSQGQGVTAPAPSYDGYGAGGYPTSTAGSGNNTAGTPSAAGSGSGGLASGEGGAAGAGGMPTPPDPCEAAQSCVSDLQALRSDTWPQLPTTPRTTECCQLVIGTRAPWGAPLQCGEETFNGHDELLWPCCEVLQSPQDTACTPWGPPVPPELDLEQLLEWAAA